MLKKFIIIGVLILLLLSLLYFRETKKDGYRIVFNDMVIQNTEKVKVLYDDDALFISDISWIGKIINDNSYLTEIRIEDESYLIEVGSSELLRVHDEGTIIGELESKLELGNTLVILVDNKKYYSENLIFALIAMNMDFFDISYGGNLEFDYNIDENENTLEISVGSVVY